MAADRKVPSPGLGDLSYGEGEFADAVHTEVAALWRTAPTLLTSIGGTANAITATGVPPFLALVEGNRVVLIPASTNTGAVTLNVDALGAADVVDRTGAALAAGALAAGTVYELVRDSGGDWRVLSSLSNTATPDAGPDWIARDEKTSGTAGGTATAGAWAKRSIGGSTFARNTLAGCSMSSDEITLPAGTHAVRWSAPAWGVNRHQTRLYNVTGASVIAYGSSEFSTTAQHAQTRSVGEHVFVLGASSAIRLEHYVSNTLATSGLGSAASFGGTEVYAMIVGKQLA